jgi:nicotinamide-nucleotide amidase
MGDATLPVLPQRIGHAARDLLEAASAAEFKLAVAESCTGGLLAAVLTDVEGYGHVFDRGFVTYSEDAKCELLGVDRALIAAVTTRRKGWSISRSPCAAGANGTGRSISGRSGATAFASRRLKSRLR